MEYVLHKTEEALQLFNPSKGASEDVCQPKTSFRFRIYSRIMKMLAKKTAFIIKF